jgi:hypothetical protein
VKAEIDTLTRSVIALTGRLGHTDFHATIADHARNHSLADHLDWLGIAFGKAERALENQRTFEPPAGAVAK